MEWIYKIKYLNLYKTAKKEKKKEKNNNNKKEKKKKKSNFLFFSKCWNKWFFFIVEYVNCLYSEPFYDIFPHILPLNGYSILVEDIDALRESWAARPTLKNWSKIS